MFFNLYKEKNLIKVIKEVLNINSSQSTVDVKSFSVQTVSFNTHFFNIYNLKNVIKKKNTVFINMNAVK